MSSAPRDESLEDDETAEAPQEPPIEESQSPSELERLRDESEQRLAGWQRAQADYQNLKRRSAQDVRDRVERSQRNIFGSLVELADDFHRALNVETTESADSDWREGVGLIHQKLIGLLERSGVYPIAAAGVPFDPNYHEAMGSLPGPDGEVVVEVRRGWLIGDRILRASQVMVGIGEPNEGEPNKAEPHTGEPKAAEPNQAEIAPEEHSGAATEGA